MTVSANPKSVFHGGKEVTETDKRDDTTDVAKEIWTALLCANIRQQAYNLGCGEQSSAPEAVQRGSDGKLTFHAPEFDASDFEQTVDDAAPGTGSSPKTTNQITFQMEAGRLGTIHLRVVREGSAVSVLVGVIDPVQRALVELELGTLTQALRSAGLTVGSVRVVHPEQVGIPFAQGKRGTPLQATDTAVSAYRGSRSRPHTEDEEGLNLVG
jgi:hypothetical protein